ncbi:MAG: ATP-dependent Clp protease proteolytic subunit [bacterium]|nr:ATP-dependent Clp protease proteolytic subunit [bacterium]MDN5835512.1 ATP-dependent Clp protease proteolytic subunit [bacterium]
MVSVKPEKSDSIEIEADKVSIDVTKDDDKAKVKKIVLAGSVDDVTISKAINSIIKLNEEESTERIELYLATHGGGIDMGIGLFDIIKLSPIPVDTIVTGCSMSMGMTLLQAGVKRYATANSRLMIHPASGGAGRGRIQEGLLSMKDSKKLERRNNRLVAQRIGMKVDEYIKFMGDAKYMSPQTALKYNFIDDIRKTW